MKKKNGNTELAQRPAMDVTLDRLRGQLSQITSAAEALNVAQRASQAKRIYEAIGLSVAECNEFTEIYLGAYWRFGDLVAGIERGRPRKTLIGKGFPGSEMQRNHARRLHDAVKESDIPEYVKHATSELEPASIAGCLNWISPHRFSYLKGEYEWYTPEPIIEAARAFMGGIDLDPASCEHANTVVKAPTYFTEEVDGLVQAWRGRVFLNPPFAHPTVKHFADKLLESYQAGDVPEAVWLSNACIDTAWWQQLASAGAVCFHLGRLKFYGPDGEQGAPPLGQTIIGLGNKQGFRSAFAPFGLVR